VNRCRVVVLASIVAIISAVDEPLAPTPPPPTPAHGEVVDRRVADLEQKIAALEANLGRGRGAYRAGASLRVDNGNESLLERVRRLEAEGEGARTAIAAKDRVIADLRQQLSSSVVRGDQLGERVDVLKHAHDSLETAQQELADRTRVINVVKEQFATSELMRLRAERLYYLLAAQVLKLPAGEAQALTDLQQQTRTQVLELKAASGSAP